MNKKGMDRKCESRYDRCVDREKWRKIKCYEEEIHPHRKTDYKPIIIHLISKKCTTYIQWSIFSLINHAISFFPDIYISPIGEVQLLYGDATWTVRTSQIYYKI